MIARVWRGVIAADQVDPYVAYVRDTGVGEYLRTPGNQLAHILTRDLGDGRAEVVAFSLWTTWDDVKRFAGDDVEAMVLYPEDRQYLLDEPTLVHYDVADIEGES